MWSLRRVKTILGQNFASLEYGNCKKLPKVPMLIQCVIHVKSQFQEKKPVLPIEGFLSPLIYSPGI